MKEFLLFLLVVGLVSASTPCYDHQKETYHAQFRPVSCSQPCSVTPFFSPDHSIDAYVDVINSAEENIDLMEPGIKSWGNCTKYGADCGGDCIGCSLRDQYNEPFPVFAALMNAVHRNVQVRYLTNNYSIDTCKGKVTPMDWMVLNGVQIRMYTTTTFMHAKTMIIDKGKKTLVSSVNFSKTSFTRNREAGVIISDCKCQLQDLYQQVFQADWDKAHQYNISGNSFSQSDMEFITNTDRMEIPRDDYPPVPNAFVTSMATVSEVTIDQGYTSPDNARAAFLDLLDTAKSTLNVHLYQITDTGICEKLLELNNRGVNVTLLVGSYIVSYEDYEEAKRCYTTLYNGGMNGKVQKTYSKFSFSHQKYCIIDDTNVHLSTGNWSPSDFPEGDSWSRSGNSVNRDMLVVMTSPDIVKQFKLVFNNDWLLGKPWEPKNSY